MTLTLVTWTSAKVSDTVDHSELIQKLMDSGIWVRDFLVSHTNIVVGHPSSPQPMTPGVSRGSIVGLILFLVYMNNLLGQTLC